MSFLQVVSNHVSAAAHYVALPGAGNPPTPFTFRKPVPDGALLAPILPFLNKTQDNIVFATLLGIGIGISVLLLMMAIAAISGNAHKLKHAATRVGVLVAVLVGVLSFTGVLQNTLAALQA